MLARDRATGLILLLCAVAAWAAVVWLLTSRSPVGQPGVQLAGAVAIGAAIGITAWPLFWLASHARRATIHDRGDWNRAGRRALIAGLTAGVLVMLRGQATLSLPLAAFVVTLAVLVELAFTLRR